MTTILPFTTSDNRRRWRHAWDIFSVLFSRDLKVIYKRSALGVGWALIAPILQLIVFTTLFRRVLATPIPNYPAYVFSGVLLWGWFQSSLAQSTSTITGSKALVRQPGFPLALLPAVTVAVRLFHLSVALPVLFILLWSGGIRPGLPWLMVPILVGIQYVLIVGLAYPLASLNVVFRDTAHIVTALLQILMFMTPVFYSADSVPVHLRPIYHLNPMVGLLEAWRDVLLRSQWPDFGTLAIIGMAGIILTFFGRKLFVAQSHRFVEEI